MTLRQFLKKIDAHWKSFLEKLPKKSSFRSKKHFIENIGQKKSSKIGRTFFSKRFLQLLFG